MQVLVMDFVEDDTKRVELLLGENAFVLFLTDSEESCSLQILALTLMHDRVPHVLCVVYGRTRRTQLGCLRLLKSL